MRTTIPASRPSSVPDRVGQNFGARAKDRLWVGDITYIRTWEGWVYLATVIDVFSRRIIGWAMAAHIRSELVENALQMAVTARGGQVAGVVFHSDRGGQGGFNWSSQRFCLEVFDGEKAAGCRSCAASEDAFAGPLGFSAVG